jgi:hypothetical protein
MTCFYSLGGVHPTIFLSFVGEDMRDLFLGFRVPLILHLSSLCDI